MELIYLAHIRSNITFLVGAMSRFMVVAQVLHLKLNKIYQSLLYQDQHIKFYRHAKPTQSSKVTETLIQQTSSHLKEHHSHCLAKRHTPNLSSIKFT